MPLPRQSPPPPAQNSQTRRERNASYPVPASPPTCPGPGVLPQCKTSGEWLFLAEESPVRCEARHYNAMNSSCVGKRLARSTSVAPTPHAGS
jgi:hypothetical protein